MGKKRKKAIKPTQVQKLNMKITLLEDELKREAVENNRIRNILTHIQLLLPREKERFGGEKFIPIEELPIAIAKMCGERSARQGRIATETEAIKRLQEIIKWLIKPSTAELRRITKEDVELMEHLKKTGRIYQ